MSITLFPKFIILEKNTIFQYTINIYKGGPRKKILGGAKTTNQIYKKYKTYRRILNMRCQWFFSVTFEECINRTIFESLRLTQKY